MTDRKTGILERDYFYIALMTVIIIGYFNRILFTDQIIRASDVVTQFIWGAKAIKEQSLLQFVQGIPGIFHADWDIASDGGRTLEGGWNAISLLFHRYLIQHFFPFPADIAWLAGFALCWGAAGMFLCCRLAGIGRMGAVTAGLLYVVCTENASLINAGHIQKLEAICWFPWVFLYMEKAVRSGRFYHYALTALMLSIQFFHMHWQISFYSCLAVGVRWFWHVGESFLGERAGFGSRLGRDFLLALALITLFFTTVAMSFAPLYNWSKQSERGDAVESSSTGSAPTEARAQEKGIGYEEGMSWSMPPEEVATLFIPGLFGYSRQEGGDVPAPGQVYYWGRMRFTQSGDYLGLLPWFLIPLALAYRRNGLTWFLTFIMAAALVMALGKYTAVYRFMFEHLPAFSKFRVPKMILFLFAFGTSMLAGIGMDVLASDARGPREYRRWLAWCLGLTVLIGAGWLFVQGAGGSIMEWMNEFITAPTRYQNGPGLADERLAHMGRDALISFGMALVYVSLAAAWFVGWLPKRMFPALLLAVALADLWRVDTRFLVVAHPPQTKGNAAKNDIVEFLKPRIGAYRMQPLNGDNAHFYSDNGLANVSAYVTISERRYKQFLDSFSLTSCMPDIMNLKYLVMRTNDFAQQKALTAKYQPVFTSPTGSVVLENRTVLPKAWLVPAVAEIDDPAQRLGILQNPAFNPAAVGIVESLPPFAMANPDRAVPFPAQDVSVPVYEGNRIVVVANAPGNALLVVGEKYYKGWKALVDGANAEIVPVDHVLRGVYLKPGGHRVEFVFDPLPFKVGKYLTLVSFVFFGILFVREWSVRRREKREA